MKVLISKGKKVEVEGRERNVQKPKYFYVDPSADFSFEGGIIKKKDFAKEKISVNNYDFFCFDSNFKDDFSHLKRLAQIITPKDIGSIITECGINKNSIVLEGGSGSGALACYLASITKKVYSYDVKKEHIDVANENASFLKLKNIKFTNKSLAEAKEKNCDVAVIDVPQPWDVIENVKKCVKRGSYICIYTPSITQVSEFLEQISEDLNYIKTIELISRKWKVQGKAVRPVSDAIGHTAFLTFVRKL